MAVPCVVPSGTCAGDAMSSVITQTLVSVVMAACQLLDEA